MKKLLFVLACLGLICLHVSGCTYSRGYKKGYAKAEQFYNPSVGKVYLPAYSYGFFRGWESYRLERARKMRDKK